MNKFSELPVLDKVATVFIFVSLAFWAFSKVPMIASSSMFSFIYEVSWLYMIIVALVTTFYFVFQWISKDLRFKSIYFYGFIIGVLTLIIMRFV